MNFESRGRDLFIVDNSVEGWTGLRYLGEWAGIAKAFDIATGYFEIGALLALEGQWQPLEKIRILMGADTTHRTRRAALEAVRARATHELDSGIETDKEEIPFSMAFLRSWMPCDPARSSAASTTGTNSTPRLTSRTPSSRWSVRRRWWARATSHGQV